MDDSVGRRRRSTSLALWVSGPVLALAAIVLLFAALPPVDCAAIGWSAGDSPQRTALIAFSSIASLGLAIAGVRQLVALRRRRQFRRRLPRLSWRAAALALAAIAALALLIPAHLLLFPLFFLFCAIYVGGMLFTGIALLGLAIAWVSGRHVEDVGAVLPLYLLGSGLFYLPSAATFAVTVGDGALC